MDHWSGLFEGAEGYETRFVFMPVSEEACPFCGLTPMPACLSLLRSGCNLREADLFVFVL